MKKTKFPQLRTKIYKGQGGQCWSYYVYDMRGTGKPDVRLGTDYPSALIQWANLHDHQPRTIGLVQEAIERWRKECLPTYPNEETKASYTRQLANIEKAFGQAAWHEVTLPVLREYLDKRTAKTQGNRELSVLSIVWGRARVWGMTALPWPAAGVKKWKNVESAREFEVTDDLFEAVYLYADRILRDCMDLATATGMRLKDTRTIRMPKDGKLRFKAGKTDKWAFFEVTQSPVLLGLIERRDARDPASVMLLTTDDGLQVSKTMLRDRWDLARDKAAIAFPKLATEIQAMYLRDMRKRAADLAEDMEAASKLLQHSSIKVTEAHYRTRATKLTAVR